MSTVLRGMNAQSIGGVLRAGRNYALAHKVITGIVVVVVVIGGWWGYSKATSTSGETRYVLGTAATSTIIASVSESGQVSASDQIDIKPKVSGEITWVGVNPGDTVHAGQALMTIDSTDARQAVTDAQKSLEAAELQFQKDTAQAPIDYNNTVASLATAQTNLSDEYNDTFNTLSSSYLDLPAVITIAQSALYGYDLDTTKNQWNMDVLSNLFNTQSADATAAMNGFKTKAKSDYASARALYDPALAAYKVTSRTSDPSVIESLLDQSITMETAVAQALQTELNFMGSVNDLAQTYNAHVPAAAATIQTNLRTNLSTVNGDLSSLLAARKAITSDKQDITTAQQNITLMQVGNTNGSNPISLQISQNSLDKQKADLATQEADLADYTIVAPFDGTISAVDVKVGDTASAAVATIVGSQQIAELTLNEVDVAKIKLGDKATLTFDAIDGLSLTGTVAEIDTVGTVSQGVVSYAIKISFDSQDSRVKSGMTVNADIQTAVDADVLTVPSSAVKTVGGQSYVQAFIPPLDTTTATAQGVVSATPPQMIPVQTGLSDDTNIEITSGLTAGQQIVVSTRTGTTATAATTAARPAGATGAAGATRTFGGGGGGGAVLRGL